MTDPGPEGFTSRRRRDLFLQLAARETGATVAEVYERARELGDQATEEAYYNIARRLSHRTAIIQKGVDGGRALRSSPRRATAVLFHRLCERVSMDL